MGKYDISEPHRTYRVRREVKSPPSFYIRCWIFVQVARGWLQRIWRWRHERWAIVVGQVLTLILLVVFAMILPLVPNPSDFENEETLRFMQAGFVIAGLYIIASAIVLLCVPLFRRTKHPRRNFTIWLKRTRNVAVGGGIAVLAAGMAFVSDDLARVFGAWIVLSIFLYIWGYLLPDGAFAPKDFQPITEAEILDAVEQLSTPSNSLDDAGHS